MAGSVKSRVTQIVLSEIQSAYYIVLAEEHDHGDHCEGEELGFLQLSASLRGQYQYLNREALPTSGSRYDKTPVEKYLSVKD